MKIKLWFLCIFLAVAAPLVSLSFFDEGSPAQLAAAIESAMTDEQALAQLIMVGWSGEEIPPALMDWIRLRNVGSVKVFGWNTGDTMRVARSIGQMQRASLASPFNIPLLIATDQEGGWIRHIRGMTSETPGNMAIGATRYPRDAYLSGYYIGKELSLVGVNMNFAPTVDLFTNRNSVVIGPRSFGSDPVQAGVLGSAFARGQLAAGIIPTAKHFPGHGDTALDSHGILPRIDVNFETLWGRELIPYRMLVWEGIPAIMSGHLAFPMTQGGNTPASLSSWFLLDVLRERIGFNGVIITDELNMIGATSYLRNFPRTAKQAIEAGNDIIMLSSAPSINDQVWTFLYNSMRTEENFRAIVRNSTRRILELKLTYLRGENSVPYIPDLTRVAAELPSADASSFFLDLAARSVTVVKPSQAELNNVETPIPLTREKAGRVLLVGRYSGFFNYGRIAFPNASSFSFSAATDPQNLIAAARNADTIIFCLSDLFDLRMLRNLQHLGRQVYVLSILSPVHIESVPWVTAAIAVYSYAPESFAAGFSAMIGRIPALGILPYEL
ncbi:MAG: glycoside hydrolase family 3 protein [Treponema sp.]|nr:glycoside hydrolase family 3 protein [Treponema sp.]